MRATTELQGAGARERIDMADISELLAYWDTTTPLVPIEDAWHGTGLAAVHETAAGIARDIRLRTEAARQVYESRLERGAEL